MIINLSQKRISYIQEALCISIAVSVGICIYMVFRISNGYWIPMTTAIMFGSISQGQGAVIKKTIDRIVGTLSGAMLCFLYISIFMYGNYHWAYLAPLLFFLGWYAFYLTANYTFYAVMITAFIPLTISIMTPDPISIGDILIKRIACTILGISIALIAEFIIYREAASTKPAMEQITDNFFQKQGNIIRLVLDSFLDNNTKAGFVGEEFNITHGTLISCISSIENYYLSIRYEFNYTKEQELFYQSLFRYLIEINRMTRRITLVMGHDKYNGYISNPKELKQLGINVSEKYNNINLYFDGKEDNISKRIHNILTNIEPRNRSNPTYFLIKALYNLSMHADELSKAVYNKKFA